MRHLLQRFLRAREGSIGLYMAVAILPISLLAGAATDFRRIETVRVAVQDASDAAVLAGAKAYLATDTDDAGRLTAARSAAGASLQGNSNFNPGFLNNLNWDVDNDPNGSGELVLTTRGEVPLAFGGLFGLDAVPIEAVAASVVELRLEVALVLDTTGSMSTNNRIGRLRTATEKLVNQLDAAARQSSRTDPLKISLVPYSNTVRVPASLLPFMDGESSGPGYNEIDPAPPTPRDRFARYPSGWGGCVETRPSDHDVRNTPPSSADPDTLFVPYFNPVGDPNEGCGVAAILPLAREVAPVVATVRTMPIGGFTNIPMGMAWGWKALTPSGGPFGPANADPYGTPDLVKAVVLMTDGENNLGGPGWTTYTGVGRMEQRRIGLDETSTFEQRQGALDTRLAQMCEAMKTMGVIIYTVRVEEGSQDLLRNCSSKRDDGTPRYWNVTDAAQLSGVFGQIGNELIAVRLSR